MPVPYLGREITLYEADGAVVPVRLWGDQFAPVLETRDGYTIVRDPARGHFHYARLSADGATLVPAEARVGTTDPGDLGVPRHLRQPAETTRRAVARARTRRGPFRWEQRRAERAAAPVDATRTEARPPVVCGTYVGLCLLIDFPDVRGTVSRAEVDDFCNQPGYRGFDNNGSVYDYFRDVSGGRVEYTNVVTAYYTAQHDKAYYSDPTAPYRQRATELIVEALADLRTKGFAFDQLTADEKGYVHALNAFYAGGWGTDALWPHADVLAPAFQASPTRTFHDYQITCMGTGDELVLGTFCHENGHMVCSFPDLYDGGGESAGTGDYCLMSTGWSRNPVQPCAFLKYDAGWVDRLRMVEPDTEYTVLAGENDFLMHRRGTREYFIIENRQRTGHDAALPDAGLAIWHVDRSGGNGYEQMLPDQHYMCSLEQADGHFDLEHGKNGGDGEDLFRGSTHPSFGATTTPDSDWWDGRRSRLELDHISPPAPAMTVVSRDGWRMGPLVVAGDHGGRVYAFGVAVGDTLAASLRDPGGTWSPWEFDWRGAPDLAAVAATGDRSNQVFVFGVAPDGTVHHIALTAQGEWGPWTPGWHGAPRLRSVTAVGDLGNRLYVFGVAADGTLHAVSRNAGGTWQPWEAGWRGAPKLRSVIPVADLDDQLHVFGLGQDDTLHMTWRDAQGRWSPWQSDWHGAPKLHALAPVADFGRQFHVFGVTADGTTFVTSRDTRGTWQPWQADWHSAPKLHGIAAVCDPRDRLYVFGVATDETVYATARGAEGAWSGWTADWHGAPKVDTLAVAAGEDNTIQVFGVTPTGGTYLTARDAGGEWTPWTDGWQRD